MDAPGEADPDVPRPPTPLARRWVRLVLGFGVGIGVGLAPFLGKLSVPGFDALLTVFPEELRPTLIPLSAFLMGLVAVGVQFLHGERLRRRHLRLAFLAAFVAVLAGFVWLVAVYDDVAVRIEIPATAAVRTFLIAPQRLAPPVCPCPQWWADEECIRETLDPRRIERCWGSRSLRRSRKTLRSGYLVLTSGFGALIGLLLLQEPQETKPRARPGPKPPPSRGRGRRPPRAAQ